MIDSAMMLSIRFLSGPLWRDGGLRTDEPRGRWPSSKRIGFFHQSRNIKTANAAFLAIVDQGTRGMKAAAEGSPYA
jgi:hypothetical protein